MEVSDNLKHCMSLSNDLNLPKTSSFDVQSPFKIEDLSKAAIDCIDVQKRFENCNNETVIIQKPTEAFKTDCSSTKLLRRTSLIKLFDPLYSIQQTIKINDCCFDTFNLGERAEFSTEIYNMQFPREIVNKTISNSCTNDTLISLESPKKVAKHLIPKILFPEVLKPIKKYSSEEFQQAMKVQELKLRKEFSQKLSEYETTCAEENRLLDSELSNLVAVNRTYSVVLSEILTTLQNMKAINVENKTKLEDLYVSNEKLKVDIKSTKEDSCNMENAFSDIYKRYEMSKGMIKNYKDNEKHLLKNIENMQLACDEQESMTILLKSQIEDLADKSGKEIDSAKKSADTQIMFLEAQLKKCEMKICSLENDLKQAKSNRDKLESICEDLMASFKA